MKKKTSSISAPFVGNGKLTEYKNKKDSWIYNQMETGEVEPGIKIDKSNENQWRFASKCRKVASKLAIASETFTINKYVKQLSSTSNHNYRFALKWFLTGNFDGASINELGLVKEMLFTKVNADFSIINADFDTSLEQMGEVSIDFATSSLICEAVVSIEVNIVTDVKNILSKFIKLDFETGDAL